VDNLDDLFDFTKRSTNNSTVDAETFDTPLGSIIEGIPPQLLTVLRPHFEERTFPKDSHLIRQGEAGDCLYVVVSGKVRIYSENENGDVNLIDHSGPGEVLGEMALLTGESRSASVVAEMPVKAMSLSASVVHELAQEHAELSKLMSNIVAKRLGAVEYDALAGKILGGYRLKRRLGKGGMAVVYEATDPADNQTVALKMMSHRLVYDAAARANFEQEFEILQSFNSPYIVRTHSRFAAFHTYFLVMEYCEGRPLDELVDEGPRPESELRVIYESLRKALEYAHSKDVIHRDVKPSNLIHIENGEVKLMDFGLAIPIDELGSSRGISGTARYLAPEILMFDPPSKKSDYFSAGMTLFELMIGRKYLQGDSFKSIIQQLKRWRGPNIKLICPDISDELIANVSSLLSPKADQRSMPPIEKSDHS